MASAKHALTVKSLFRFLKRKASILLIAFMLGMSNVILEEDRMVNDTRQHLEQQEIADEDELNDAILYNDALIPFL